MLVAAALLGGCERDEAIFITRVYPADLLPQGVSGDAATQVVSAALKDKGFLLTEGSKQNYVGKLEVRRETRLGADDHWMMRVVLVPRDGSYDAAVPMEGIGESGATDAVPSQAQLAQAAAAAVGELAAQRKLIRKNKDALRDALSHDSRRIRDFAIRLAGQRRAKELTGALCERLQAEPEADLVLRIVGSLVQIGDASAVSPLVELTKKKHPIFINQIVFAVAQIGGQEAEAYLDTLAAGHPSDQVRNAAKTALNELLDRKGQQGMSQNDR